MNRTEALPVVPKDERAGVNRVDNQIRIAVPVEVGKRGTGRVFAVALHPVGASGLLEFPVALVQIQVVGIVQSA